MAIELSRSDRNEASPGRVVVSVFHLSIEPATLLLPTRKWFWSQRDSKLDARLHGRIILESTSGLQNCLTQMVTQSAEFVFAILCRSDLLEQPL